jgi:acetamidase/formamidase
VAVNRPLIEVDDTVQVVGFGETVEAATEDAARAAVDYAVAQTTLARDEAYMLLSIVGELRIGTSPRPVMAARVIIPRRILDAARA